MTNIFIKLLVCFLLFSCSGFEFVYNDASDANKIKGKTYLSVSGDDTEIVYAYAINKIQNNENNHKYALSIKSKKIVEAVVIEKDATASKFNIKLDIFYRLLDNINNCVILEKSFITQSTFDSKSAGYSFGTDLSQKEVLERTIHSNIDEFLLFLIRSEKIFNC